MYSNKQRIWRPLQDISISYDFSYSSQEIMIIFDLRKNGIRTIKWEYFGFGAKEEEHNAVLK